MPSGIDFSFSFPTNLDWRVPTGQAPKKALLETRGCHVSLQGVKYSVELQKKEAVIISDMNLNFRTGRLTAVLGAEGAGKSSLLKCLVGDVRFEGQVLFNGSSPPAGYRRHLGYFRNDKTLIGSLTVRRYLQFEARLRLPREVSIAEAYEHVEQVIAALGLGKVSDSVIDGTKTTDPLTNDQRIRVKIALELIHDPTMLLLDEPTSGLDTATAYSVVRYLAAIAKKENRTVICSIHEPASNLFEFFSDVLVLVGGKPCFFGPSEALLEYFEQLGYAPPHGIQTISAWLSDISNGLSTPSGVEKPFYVEPDSVLLESMEQGEAFRAEEAKAHRLARHRALAFLFGRFQSTFEEPQRQEVEGKIAMKDELKCPFPYRAPKYAQTYWTQLGIISHRVFFSWLYLGYFIKRLIPLLMACLLVIVFLPSGTRGAVTGGAITTPDTTTMNEFVGLIPLHTVPSILFLWMLFCSAFPLVFVKDLRSSLDIFAQERGAKTYSVLVYMLSVILYEIPLMFGLFSSATILLLAGVNIMGSVEGRVLIMVQSYLVFFSSYMFLFLLCALFRRFEDILLIFAGIVYILALVGGFVHRILPPWWDWVRYVSNIWYGFSTGMRVTFPTAFGAVVVDDGINVGINIALTIALAALSFILCYITLRSRKLRST